MNKTQIEMKPCELFIHMTDEPLSQFRGARASARAPRPDRVRNPLLNTLYNCNTNGKHCAVRKHLNVRTLALPSGRRSADVAQHTTSALGSRADTDCSPLAAQQSALSLLRPRRRVRFIHPP
ncbi:unnamed protein product [Colias eurytheme]|nr:unnamed protein product [Colias eurytheme]